MKLRLALLIFLVASLLVPTLAFADTGSFDIQKYKVVVNPRPDGTLDLTYDFNWCVTSGNMGDPPWFTIGLPNQHFEVVGWEGDIASVEEANKGSWTGVKAILTKQVNAGECFMATVRIHQGRMAHPNERGELSYQFIPSWYDHPVRLLRIAWVLPEDKAQLLYLDPEPLARDANVVWETSLQPGSKFKVEALYAAGAFPEFSVETAQAESPESNLLLLWIILGIIGGLLLLFLVAAIAESSEGDYSGGSFIGGYRGGGYGGAFGGRSGGGAGAFGGRGSGCACACVSCACACACAGGSGAGCRAKGFGIQNLPAVIRLMQEGG